MHHFTLVLNDLLREQKLSQIALARLGPLEKTKIHRFVHGTTLPGRQDLETLLAIFPVAIDRSRLLLSYLQDTLPADALASLSLPQTVSAHERKS